ncbi:MAG: restriction endonuclease subunit S, partial [Rhabdochlamydiaceae bacterium]
IPPFHSQLELVQKVSEIELEIRSLIEAIDRIRDKRNKELQSELGIELEFSKEKGDQYGLPIDDVIKDPSMRLDFQYNRPSFSKITRLDQGKFKMVEIDNQTRETKILLGKITSGSTPSGGIYPTRGISFVQVANVQDNKLDMTEHEFITEEFHSSLSRSTINGEEVLVTIAGTIGRAAINQGLKDANVNQAIAVLRINSAVMLPLFLSSFLNSDAGKIQFAKYRHDFGTPNINQTELGKLRVPFPPLSIQEKIVSNVKKREQEIIQLETRLREKVLETSEYITQFLIGKNKYEDVHQRIK